MPRLFEPITLRELTVRNRIWLAPMCQYSCENRDGVPGAWHLVHLGARAQGGFGLVMSEAAAVVPEGRISPQDAGIWNDDQAHAWAQVAEFVHSQHAAFGVQLAHAGRKASTFRPFVGEPKGSVPVDEGGWASVGPSDLAFPGLAAPRGLSQQEIAEVVAAFGAAAARADAAGIDVVEIHAAHGYLIHEFLSPLSNTRTDAYGGTLENRARLLFEVYEAVRANFSESKPVLVRMSASEWTEGGFDIAEATEVAVQLQHAGVDLIDVSSGGNVLADIPIGPSYQVPLAGEIAGAGVTTGAVGLITEPAQAEGILATGDADVVLLARAALREPNWPLRAAHELGLDWREAPYPPQYTRGKW
ncbi:NADH:flavin oxidoreductase/NADH oxidase [Brevibacterium daeguense]|uniref:NADH:flavin oxidoreductase/NADH oxidase n=1 Tax=Brevibacterium daeguense TaxID=909936 RepID=A0ABP8EJI2_9MICO|nr:NADH:flavin oxidoreductase/NADH oxidase [Brevibacterium daeguense]